MGTPLNNYLEHNKKWWRKKIEKDVISFLQSTQKRCLSHKSYLKRLLNFHHVVRNGNLDIVQVYTMQLKNQWHSIFVETRFADVFHLSFPNLFLWSQIMTVLWHLSIHFINFWINPKNPNYFTGILE